MTLADILDGTGKSKTGYDKLRFCADQANCDGLQYFWVDTCCIDKSSSAELAEAIISMFRWYRESVKCYVYLADVSNPSHDDQNGGCMQLAVEEAFRRCRWFTRGWTLQELIAPPKVEFFASNNTPLGDKSYLEAIIHEVTGIATGALRGHPLSGFGIEQRFSWAANRETTRLEDKAYSLLGIFDISMPVLYGEGEKRAFQRLQEEIQKSEMSGQHMGLKGMQLDCLRALRSSEYEQFKYRNPDRLDGTCEWVLKHDYYQRWQDGRSSGLLWVSADPGCGKSVLAKSLIDREIQPTNSRVTCYFFFKDDNEKQKHAFIALSALLHQLFSQVPLLIQHAIRDYEADGHKLQESFHKLWGILLKAASDPRAGEVICILDALDECVEADRYQLMDAIKTLYSRPTPEHYASRLKFLVTSRPYYDIERRFNTLFKSFPTIRLHGEAESEQISQEINLVARSRVSDLGRELDLTKSEQVMLEKELLSMKHRTYLWLKLVVDVLKNAISPAKSLKQITVTMPATVDQAYEAILGRVTDQSMAQKLLHIVVAATRPITLTEMRIALAIENQHRCYSDLDFEHEARFESWVRNLCGLFIVVADQKIYLIHQTARDFLLAKHEVHTGQWKHSFRPGVSDLALANICITYLMFTDFNGATEQKVTSAAAAHGFFDYAASSWATHFRAAQNIAGNETVQLVEELCQPGTQRFQLWFHAYWNMTYPYEQCPDSFTQMMLACYFGHDSVVRKWLDADKMDVNAKDEEHGGTALIWAAENGHEAVVELLLGANNIEVNVQTYNGWTALMWAAVNGHAAVVKLLLKVDNINVNVKEKKYGSTALMWAAENGHIAVVQLLLGVGNINVNAKHNGGWTAQMWAAANGHETVVKLLQSHSTS